jgi:hypothetical protein
MAAQDTLAGIESGMAEDGLSHEHTTSVHSDKDWFPFMPVQAAMGRNSNPA